MKLIIAGSRHLHLCTEGIQAFINFHGITNITEIVSGGARGIDAAGEQYAKDNNIPCTVFPAEWDEYGKAAGFIRNKEMAEYADELFLVWNDKSPGSRHMRDTMIKLGKSVHEGTF